LKEILKNSGVFVQFVGFLGHKPQKPVTNFPKSKEKGKERSK